MSFTCREEEWEIERYLGLDLQVLVMSSKCVYSDENGAKQLFCREIESTC